MKTQNLYFTRIKLQFCYNLFHVQRSRQSSENSELENLEILHENSELENLEILYENSEFPWFQVSTIQILYYPLELLFYMPNIAAVLMLDLQLNPLFDITYGFY